MKAHDRYEDYIAHDLVFDVDRRFPVKSGRSARAIAGVSMGGYGTVKLALDRPDLFAFAGAISAALDVPTRPFSVRRFGQWERFREIFGLLAVRPIRLAIPTFLCSQRNRYEHRICTSLAVNRRRSSEPIPDLQRSWQKEKLALSFIPPPGGHDWGQWDEQIPGLFGSLLQHLQVKSPGPY
jgi:enterochelin esterase-like enzyme